MRDELIARITSQHAFGKQANEFASSESRQLLALLDSLPDMIYLKNCEGRFVFANTATLLRIGGKVVDGDGQGVSEFDFLTARSAALVRETELQVLRTGEAVFDIEENISFKASRPCWLSTTKVPIRNDAGEIIGIAGISRDITERKRQETLSRGHASLLEMIVRGQPLEAILQSLVLLVESLLQGIRGSVLLFDEDTGRLRHGSAPSLPEAYIRLIDGVEAGPRVGSCGTAAWRREPVVVCDILNDPLWEDYTGIAMRYGLRSCWSTPIMGAGGGLLGTFALYSGAARSPSAIDMEMIEVATNIAGIAIDRKRSEERAHFMAHHDPLTGLSNRTLFWAQFSRALHEARREDRMVAITYLDLDNFKQINDVYGHAAGDEVLRATADRITSCIRASDIAVRLGGDEFAIVFSNPKHDEDGILRRVEAIRSAVAQPTSVEGAVVIATCSIGVAFYPADGDTPESLLARADSAMYQAKRLGRDRFKIFLDGGDGI